MSEKKKCKRIPELIVILICIVVSCIAVSRKEGYHMDELISYEFANAMYNPWIVPTQPQGRLAKFVENEIQGDTPGETLENLVETVEDVLKNRGNSIMLSYKADVYEEPVWISSKQFQDYITVGEGDAFNYLSVYFNVKDDNHPPLHFMLLHTVCSLVKGSAAPVIGCIINIIAVVGIVILLMWMGNRLSALYGLEKYKRTVGILAALCYIFSAGALATTLLIRMYAMLTFFCVAFLGIHVYKWSEEKFDRKNKLLIAVTVMGFLTQYFFLFYCLVLAAVTAVLLWKNKRSKELLIYIRTMVIAALLGVAIFPFSIADVFSSGRGVEALNNLSQGFAGFGSRIASFWTILSENTFGWAVLLGLIIIAVTWSITAILGKYGDKSGETKRNRKEIYPILFMLTVPVLGYFLLASRMSPYLVDRYIMPIFPLVILVGVLLVLGLAVKATERFGNGKILYGVCGCLILCQVCNWFGYSGNYYYSGYKQQIDMSEVNAEYPCICVYDGVGYYENLVEFTNYEKTLLVTEAELDNRQDTASITELDTVVLLLKQYVDDEHVLDIMEEKYGFTVDKTVIRGDGAHGDTVLLMSREE